MYKRLIDEKYHDQCIFLGTSGNLFETFKDAFNTSLRNKLKTVIKENQPDILYLHNYHLLNNYIGKIVSKMKTRFIYHVHEPYTKNKKNHGGIQQYWLYVFEYQQEKLLNYVDDVILSSDEAIKLFEMRYPSYTGRRHKIPLMYEDENVTGKIDFDREYITFIGPPVPAKGPEIFLKLIDETNRMGLGYKYLLVSRTPIEDKIYNKENLTIFHKPFISNEEIADAYKKSLVVMTPYTRATQSSVVLTSFMFGTPVLSTNVGGLKEFISHKKIGYVLDINANADKWIQGLNFLIDNNRDLVHKCRKYFVDNFSDENWKKYINEIITVPL